MNEPVSEGEHSGVGHSGVVWSAAEQSGMEQSGAKQNGAEWSRASDASFFSPNASFLDTFKPQCSVV